MSTLKKFNLSCKELGQVKSEGSLAHAEANSQMIKDYIVAIRANARQWSASTKTRAEVKHTTKKASPQKGQGRARHGSTVAPQYRGGGRAHGPRPKFDQHVRINQKERQAAIRFLLSEKIKAGHVRLVDSMSMKEPKTKTIAGFLKAVGVQGRTLFLGDSHYAEVETAGVVARATVSSDKHDNFIKSARNLPKTQFRLASNISGYDVMVAKEIVLTEEALKELQQWLD